VNGPSANVQVKIYVKMSCFALSGVFSPFIGIYLTNVRALAKNNIGAAVMRHASLTKIETTNIWIT